MSELEAELVLEAGGQRPPQGIRGESGPVTVLQLGEQHLWVESGDLILEILEESEGFIQRM